MNIAYEFAKKMQFMDKFVPGRWRVPFRYLSQRIFGGLEPEMRFLSRLVKQGSIAVDVGGNRGTYTYALSKLCRQVITFEPIPSCAEMLQQWGKNKNVTVYECALGEHEGTLALHLPRLHGALVTTRASLSRTDGEGIDFAVPIKTLDQFELEEVSFIKIDVEGFELATLKGARKTLARLRPNLLVEIDPLQQSAEAFRSTFSWIEDQGYRGHYMVDGALTPCDARIQLTKPNCYNFIFLPATPP